MQFCGGGIHFYIKVLLCAAIWHDKHDYHYYYYYYYYYVLIRPVCSRSLKSHAHYDSLLHTEVYDMMSTSKYGLRRIRYSSIQRSESYGHADWCHSANTTNQNVRLNW